MNPESQTTALTLAGEVVADHDITIKTPLGKLALPQKVSVSNALMLSASDSRETAYPVPWWGTQFLQSIIEKKVSCFVTGGDGTGKSSAVDACELELSGDPSLVFFCEDSTAGFINRLWQLVGRPLPDIASRVCDVSSGTAHRSWLARKRTGIHRMAFCTCCRSECVISESPLLPSPTDIDEALSNMSVICPLLTHLIKSRLRTGKGKCLIVDLPTDADDTVANLLSQLADGRKLILVGNEPQLCCLRQIPQFSSFPTYQFPVAGEAVLEAVAAERLTRSGTQLPEGILKLSALLSEASFTKHLTLLGQLVVSTKDEVTATDVLAALNWEVDDAAMVKIALASMSGKLSSKDVAARIYQLFNRTVSTTKIGLVLKALPGIVARRKPIGRVYELPPTYALPPQEVAK